MPTARLVVQAPAASTSTAQRTSVARGSSTERKCLKEGCGRALTGRQTKRCKEHHMRCARKDCSNFIQEHHSPAGLCYKHAGGVANCRAVRARVCLKEGCGKPLIGQQKKRCKEHHWQCAKLGCTKNEQANYGGYCKKHHFLVVCAVADEK